MRKILLCTAAVSLSGCSFLGFGGQKNYNQYSAPVSHTPAPQCPKGSCYSRWNLEGGVGVATMIDGTAFTADELGTDLNDQSMSKMYNTGYRAEIGGSYALNPNQKLIAMAHYEHADDAGVTNMGQIGGADFVAAMTDYEAIGGEIGIRQYFQPQRGFVTKSIRPYIEGRVGLSHVDDIQLQNAELGGAAFNGGNPVAFYDDSWVGSAAGLIGIETPISRFSTIGIETGLRYREGLDADDSDVGGTPLDGTNRGGSNLSVPVMLRGRYRF